MRVGIFVIMMWSFAVLGTAQEVPPTIDPVHDPLPKSVQRVFVHSSASDAELQGRLLEIGPKTLAMIVNGQRVELPLENVLKIEVPGDSLKNGALIGALVGGLWCALVCGQGLDHASQLPAAIGLSAAFWAAVGAGIDAAIPGRTTIYSSPSSRHPARHDARAGVLFSLRF